MEGKTDCMSMMVIREMIATLYLTSNTDLSLDTN